MSDSLIDLTSTSSNVGSMTKCMPMSRITGDLLMVARPMWPGMTRTNEIGPFLMCVLDATFCSPFHSNEGSLM